jgi:heterotetrameric sarcosine oxidase gamma subunit
VLAPDNVRISRCVLDIFEISAAGARAHELVAQAREGGLELPAIGRVATGAERLILCVRPGRWLILAPPGTASADLGIGLGAVVDLSAGYEALLLQGTHNVEVLARGCRLDLDPLVFPPGHAAATIMAQVPAILAALPTGMLLLTPASTARHFTEWLSAAARAFGLMPQSVVSVADLCRSRIQ